MHTNLPEQRDKPTDNITNAADTPANGLFDRIILTALRLRGWVMLLVLVLCALGVYSYQKLPIDAVPDITNVQVQINSDATGFTAQETEQLITYPIETAMSGLPHFEQTRSISRYGLSQVTVIFKDGTDIYFVRQLINQRLQELREQLPEGIAPVMSPVSTGLGEIYQWVLVADADAKNAQGKPYTAAELRELQDWVVKPQLRNISGVAEVNTIGGFEREYQVQPDYARLSQYNLTLADLQQALESSNQNRGAGFVSQQGQQLTIRLPATLKNTDAIASVVIKSTEAMPIRVKDVATVNIGHQLRSGAATLNGEEAVLGTVMMRSGANSRDVALAVAQKMPTIQKSLPEGVVIKTVYNRSHLVDKAISTVRNNLTEGALLVIVILFLFLGNVRAAIITACVIPLSMLFTMTGMVQREISANLMSLGALDFGIIVDGAVVIVENSLRRLAIKQQAVGRLLNRQERFTQVFLAAKEARRPLIYGQLIIMAVYLPVFALTGVEGKMFHPMAATVMLALLGAMILSVTFVPAAVALFVTGKVQEKESALMRWAAKIYQPTLRWSLSNAPVVLVSVGCAVVLSLLIATKMGSEFAPTLSEGDMAVQSLRSPSTSIDQSVSMQQLLERTLLEKFDEIEHVFARTGTAEVASDPMPPNISDTIIILKPKEAWQNPSQSIDELKSRMTTVVDAQVGSASEFSQPIEMRFNELISGVRSTLAVKVYGDDLDTLAKTAEEVADKLRQVNGATAVTVEQTKGQPMLQVRIHPTAASRYGLQITEIQDIVTSAIGGLPVGQIFQGDRRYRLVIRQLEGFTQPNTLKALPIPLSSGSSVRLAQVADVRMVDAPIQVSRENGKRNVMVTANVTGRDLGTFISDVQSTMDSNIRLPSGYWLGYGGQFENLQSAKKRFMIVVPAALLIVFLLLYAMFASVKDSVIVFLGIPFALSGGIVALWLRDIPLSVSAGVGFIALCGVAVLNGLVMLSFIRDLRDSGLDVAEAVWQGAQIRLRPVLMTALVASLGFIPMAIATGTGSEVQRPLATVVIGGIMSSTMLTLVVLPLLYQLVYASKPLRKR